MMGHRQVEQSVLFYEFSLEKHVPADHLLRSIDRFVDLDGAEVRVALRSGGVGSWRLSTAASGGLRSIPN